MSLAGPGLTPPVTNTYFFSIQSPPFCKENRNNLHLIIVSIDDAAERCKPPAGIFLAI
jgi:hypothetical protein